MNATTNGQQRKREYYASQSSKPAILAPCVESIPDALRERNQWVNWALKWDAKKGKWDKPPISPGNGRGASSTDPTTWGSLDDAVAQSRNTDGIGYVFAEADPYTGVDLDDAIDADGNVRPWARLIIDELDTYTEISPSGIGVKLWLSGRMPDDSGHRKKCGDGEIEVYDKGRYFTVTGKRLPNTPETINDRQVELEQLLRTVGLLKPPGASSHKAAQSGGGATLSLSDDVLIGKALAAKNGAKFAKLWRGDTGDYGNDESRADEALCFLLAYWFNRDAVAVDRVFRQSGLMRDKWEREDYRERTIMNAVNGCKEVYSPQPLVRLGKHPTHTVTLESGSEEIKPVDLLTDHLTDVGNGRRLVALHGRDLRYCHPWDKWLAWDSMRWREDDTGAPELRAKDTCRAMLETAAKQAAEYAARLGDAENEEQEVALKARIENCRSVQTFAIKSESAARIAAMIALATSEPSIPILPAVLNIEPWLLNCINGTVDLRTGKLRDHRRADSLTQLCPTAFDPKAKCPTWERLLTDIFPSGNQLIGYVYRLFGYIVSGDVREQILPIFYGGGANGKSTLLNAFMDMLGSDFAIKAPPNLLIAKKTESHPTEQALLFGKRLVCAIETDNGAKLAESVVKELTGGDPITARRMREDFWTFNPTHKLILCTNHKPKVQGRDHAIWRRLRLIPFNRKFELDEQDKLLPEKLLAESAGILAWAVRGCLEWQARGLGEAPEVSAATAEYRSGEDALAGWIAECCLTGSSCRARASDLFRNYLLWLERAHERGGLSRRQFCEAMREAGFDEATSNGLWFLGITLRQEDPLEP